MASKQYAAAAPPATERVYDPEIKDMASYIHNYNIDSDLAVGVPRVAETQWRVDILELGKLKLTD